MMMGIPGQTIKNMESDRQYLRNADHIDNWIFHPFWMGYPNTVGGDYTAWESKITLDPEKYGYSKDLSPAGVDPGNIIADRMNWVNDHTSFLDVLSLEEKWRAKDEHLQKVGGIHAMYHRGMGLDVDNHIGKTFVKDIDKTLSPNTVARVKKYIENILSDKVEK